MKLLGILALACTLGALSIFGMTATSSMLTSPSASNIKSSNVQEDEEKTDSEEEDDNLKAKKQAPDDIFVQHNNEEEVPPITKNPFGFQYSRDDLTPQQKMQELCQHYGISLNFAGANDAWYLENVAIPVCERVFPYLEGETKHIDVDPNLGDWGYSGDGGGGIGSGISNRSMEIDGDRGTAQYQFAYGLLHEGAHNKHLMYENTPDAIPQTHVLASTYALSTKYEQFAEFYAKAVLEPEYVSELALTRSDWAQDQLALNQWLVDHGKPELPTYNMFPQNDNYSFLNPVLDGYVHMWDGAIKTVQEFNYHSATPPKW